MLFYQAASSDDLMTKFKSVVYCGHHVNMAYQYIFIIGDTWSNSRK
jgi:hypothetical protein